MDLEKGENVICVGLFSSSFTRTCRCQMTITFIHLLPRGRSKESKGRLRTLH